MNPHAILIFAAALLAPPLCFAQSSTPLIDGPALVGAPPAVGSPRAEADRAAMGAAVDDARLAQARADLAFDPFAMFRPVLGDGFTRERFPRTAALFAATVRGFGPALNAAKTAYPRARPYLADAALLRCDSPANPPTNDSYPTGHGAGGWALALALAEVLPAHADALLQRGRDFGDSRVICGYHFPSDVEASRLIAAGAVARLHGDAEYRALLDAARAELAAFSAQ